MIAVNKKKIIKYFRGQYFDYILYFIDYPSSTTIPLQNGGDEKIKTLNKSAIINRTRLSSCDKTIKLYTVSPSIKSHSANRPLSCDR